MSLDWQELPPDYLNLTTQRSYTLAEARDLINRHLQSRGFTMLERGETLIVVNLTKLDPSPVPRVDPDNLEDHRPHAFFKTTFDLSEGLNAESTAVDIKRSLKTTRLRDRSRAVPCTLDNRQWPTGHIVLR